MTKPTRAEKREAINLFVQTVSAAAATRQLVPSEKMRRIYDAILDDYEPISEERRAELELQQVVMDYVLSEADADVEDDPENEYTAKRRRIVQGILSEIEAELEEWEAEPAAILTDYAPISEERRAELEWRRRHLEVGVGMWEPGDEHHEMCKRWLAEINAELEGPNSLLEDFPREPVVEISDELRRALEKLWDENNICWPVCTAALLSEGLLGLGTIPCTHAQAKAFLREKGIKT